MRGYTMLYHLTRSVFKFNSSNYLILDVILSFTLYLFSAGSIAEATRNHALSLLLLLLSAPSALSLSSPAAFTSLTSHPHALPHASHLLLSGLPPTFVHVAMNVLLPCLGEDDGAVRLCAVQSVYWLLARIGYVI